MERVESSPVQGVTWSHRERDDDQGDVRWEQRYQESQEQEACPFSLTDSFHGEAGGNGGKVRTWEPGKDEREAGNGKATRKKKEKEKKSEKRERNQVVDTVLELKGTIDRASTMASSMRRAAAKACPTLIVKAPGAVVLVYFYLLLFASLYYYIFIIFFIPPIMVGGVARK
jgi:hypothetical protein